MTTDEFIQANRHADVLWLTLRAGRHAGVDMPFALDQIAGWQTATRKLPSWAAVDGVVYPPHLSMEQCSSEFTARYKAALARRISADKTLFVDLTGGMGVDFSFMSRGFGKAVYVERQSNLCENALHNFPLLGVGNAEAVNSDGVEYLRSLSHASVIYLDPARRDANGGKAVAISDCTPDVVSLLDELLTKADSVIIKLSPMLDWHKAMAELKRVTELHIISSGNECKELLFVLSRETPISSHVFCVNNNDIITFPLDDASLKPSIIPHLIVGMHLYEPSASVMKAGCFGMLCERYGVKTVGDNSHLFVSPDGIGDFPGRGFIIKAISTLNKNDLKKSLTGIDRANITTRNFPVPVAELRKKLHLKDGGETYIFATTASDGKRLLLVCQKI